MTPKMNALETLFPDDPKARNKRYAAQSIASLEADVDAGRCPGTWAQEHIDVLKVWRDAL